VRRGDLDRMFVDDLATVLADGAISGSELARIVGRRKAVVLDVLRTDSRFVMVGVGRGRRYRFDGNRNEGRAGIVATVGTPAVGNASGGEQAAA
jgi:hypothetical protein